MVNQSVAKKPGAAKGRRYIGSEIVFNLILTVFVILCVLPVIHVVALSMSGRNAVLSGQVYLWPKEWDFSAYTSVINDPTMTNSMWFSIWLTLVYTALSMVSTILLAYPLSRKYIPGRKWLMVVILIPMYFTGGTIPNYLWVKQMGLIDSPWSLIWPILTSTYNTIILRNFFESVPTSLEESAKLDGCNDWQVLFKIILPLSTASLATIALFYAALLHQLQQVLHFADEAVSGGIRLDLSGSQHGRGRQGHDTGRHHKVGCDSILHRADTYSVPLPTEILRTGRHDRRCQGMMPLRKVFYPLPIMETQ